jgi:hypothetical protein
MPSTSPSAFGLGTANVAVVAVARRRKVTASYKRRIVREADACGNPGAVAYSESQFKTMKYRPNFPDRFQSIEQARAFCQAFFAWYNYEHQVIDTFRRRERKTNN